MNQNENQYISFFIRIVINAKYVLLNDIVAAIMFVKYWEWILWKSSRTRYIDLVKKN